MTLQTVIVVSDSAQFDGGLGKVAVTSAIALASRGLNVIFFCPIAGVDPALYAAGVQAVCLEQDAPSEDPNRLRGMRRGIWNGQVAKALKSLCEIQDPTTAIVHCHGFSKALSPAIGPVLTSGRLASVYTMHEFFLACPNGSFFDFPRAKICTRRPMNLSCLSTQCDSRHAVHKVWRTARQLALKGPGRMPRALEDVIYISQTQRDVMAPHLNPKTRLHHVANPVDLGNGPRVRADENDLFVFVGRLEPDKGALDFANAAKSAGVRAAFVGAGRQEAAIRGILPDATITGWVGPTEVAHWLSKARALVFPSLWQETFGLVAYEALARGVPVITGAWNAASEGIVPNETGIIYQAPQDLAAALKRMDGATAERMSIAAFARREHYGTTPDAHADKLVEVYESALQKRTS